MVTLWVHFQSSIIAVNLRPHLVQFWSLNLNGILNPNPANASLTFRHKRANIYIQHLHAHRTKAHLGESLPLVELGLWKALSANAQFSSRAKLFLYWC